MARWEPLCEQSQERLTANLVLDPLPVAKDLDLRDRVNLPHRLAVLTHVRAVAGIVERPPADANWIGAAFEIDHLEPHPFGVLRVETWRWLDHERLAFEVVKVLHQRNVNVHELVIAVVMAIRRFATTLVLSLHPVDISNDGHGDAFKRHRHRVMLWLPLGAIDRSLMAEGRTLLRQLLTGPLTFTPDRDGTYRFEGEATLGGLLAGCGLTPPTILASPRGRIIP